MPTHDERALFEALSLGLFETGMSWSAVFRKRPAFQAAFDDFEPARVARYTDADVQRLLADRDIIRNRRKDRGGRAQRRRGELTRLR
jgi:DNA-3-methyladenine glycosylase I